MVFEEFIRLFVLPIVAVIFWVTPILAVICLVKDRKRSIAGGILVFWLVQLFAMLALMLGYFHEKPPPLIDWIGALLGAALVSMFAFLAYLLLGGSSKAPMTDSDSKNI